MTTEYVGQMRKSFLNTREWEQQIWTRQRKIKTNREEWKWKEVKWAQNNGPRRLGYSSGQLLLGVTTLQSNGSPKLT